MKYLIYARVSPKGSSWDGVETSIQMQIDYCNEYIRFHGGEVIDVVSDEFYSGKNTARPGFSRIIDQLKSGCAPWDTLIVYKLSRMSRSLRDGAEIFATLFEQGKGFISATEHLDFSTPSGRAMLGVMQVFNQFEREQTAENIRNKMISIASHGLWPTGNPPFGYKRGEKKDNKLYIDPRKSQIVKDIFEMYASPQFNTVDILNKYRDTIHKSALFAMLRNRVYLGKIVYADHEFPGQHEPIISEYLFNTVQSLISKGRGSGREKAQKYPYLLTGLLKCQCGFSMSPASAKGGKYHYYVCGNMDCKKRVKAESIEKAVLDQLERFRSDNAILDCLEKKLIKAKSKIISTAKPEMEEAIVARREATEEREKVYKAIIALGDNSNIDFMNNKINSLSDEITRLTAKIDMLKEQINNEDSAYDDIRQEIDVMRNTASILKHARKIGDIFELKKIILTHVFRVVNIGLNHYQIEPCNGSSKCSKWWSMAELLELLKIKIS